MAGNRAAHLVIPSRILFPCHIGLSLMILAVLCNACGNPDLTQSAAMVADTGDVRSITPQHIEDSTGPSAGSVAVPAWQAEPEYWQAALSIVQAMTDHERAGQVIMTSVDGQGFLTSASQALLADIKPGAVLLFGYNIPVDAQLVAAFSDAIRDAAAVNLGLDALRDNPVIDRVVPFVAIDHEGGLVYRFKSGLTRLPSARRIGSAGMAAAWMTGDIAGMELSALGINLNLAPVVEALDDRNSSFLQTRAWSTDPALATDLAVAFMSACQARGVAAVAKHFPGNVAVDPHHQLPVLDVDMAILESQYLPPFRRSIAAGAAAIMLSHILVPSIDPLQPVPLSRHAIEILKGSMRFDGIVLSDDLAMAAIVGTASLETAALAALVAGVDMLMVSGSRSARAVRDAILLAIAENRLDRDRLRDAATRILAQKLRFDSANQPADQDLTALVNGNRQRLGTVITP